MIEVPTPAGVVFALIPSTNPVATVFFKIRRDGAIVGASIDHGYRSRREQGGASDYGISRHRGLLQVPGIPGFQM